MNRASEPVPRNSPKKNLLTLTGKEAFAVSSCHSVYDHNETNLPDAESDDPIAPRAKTSQGGKHWPPTLGMPTGTPRQNVGQKGN